jgi:hypothetical protein
VCVINDYCAIDIMVSLGSIAIRFCFPCIVGQTNQKDMRTTAELEKRRRHSRQTQVFLQRLLRSLRAECGKSHKRSKYFNYIIGLEKFRLAI